MNFGTGEEWMLGDRDTGIDIIQQALDMGINTLDTANVYSRGESESIVGEAIEGYDREVLVLATKVFGPMGDGPNKQGLSRKHIIAQAEASLDRLGTDYIDLYQIHRWDEHTPIEETLSALDSLVTAGKVRYIGASTMTGWQFSKALHTATVEGYERFVSMQPEYSLIARHEEENLLPICADTGIGVLPWSPLADGVLTGKYDRNGSMPADTRGETFERVRERLTENAWQVLDVVNDIAREHDATPAQISLAWLLHKPVVDAPIMGPRTMAHLEANIGALELELADEEIERLEAPLTPRWRAEDSQ